MDSTRALRIVIIVVAAVLLFGTVVDLRAPRGRQPLPEDAPALLGNRALDDGGAGLSVAVARALDPAAAWDPAGEVVGRARFRPVAVALLAVERTKGRSGTLALVSLVSLGLHLLVAFGVVGLLCDLGASRAALWSAGLLVATAPTALAAVGWPARQPVVLAAALGVTGLRWTLSSSAGPRIAGALLLALACLSHEAALGLAAAALVLVVRSRQSEHRGALGAVLPVVVAVGLALGWRFVALSGLDAPPPGNLGPDLADAAVGMLTALLAPLLPAHLHLAGDPWTAATWARIVCPAVLVLGAVVALRGARGPRTSLWLATLAAAAPVLGTALTGGTPFHHGYSYVVLPVLACALGWTFADAVARGGAQRMAASTAGALLLGASVAGTLVAGPQLRDRASFVELAARAAPDSPVVHAWRVGDLAATAPESGPARGAALLAALPTAVKLADRLVGLRGEPTDLALALRRDGAGGVGVAAALAGFARRLAATDPADLPRGSAAFLPDLESVAAAATAVAPAWDGGWMVLAQARAAVGANGTALDAAEVAAALRPGDPRRLELVARLALAVGRTEVAIERMATASVLEQEQARDEGRRQRREHLMLHAEALAADATTSGLLAQYGWALRELLPLYEAGDRETDLRSLIYDIHLRWADGLASLDRTAQARIAYERAARLGGSGSEAAEHLAWLETRLQGELVEANSALERAASGEGNVANALLAVAIVQCRAGAWETADAIFAKIEEGQGGMNAGLRFTRAVHRYAAREDELDIAQSELRKVLEEEPSFQEARYRLAGVLLELGDIEGAAEEYRRASREGAAFEWAIEALELARRLEAVLARPSR